MLVGVVKLAPSLPIDTLFPFFTLNGSSCTWVFIFMTSVSNPLIRGKTDGFATTLLLIALVVLLNLGAIFIRERLRRKYATGAF